MIEAHAKSILALDYGAKRIGVARASGVARLPQALETIIVDGTELDQIKALQEEYDVDTIVVGWPRNVRGEETFQTKVVDGFISELSSIGCTIVKQDETLSSVQAEQHLRERRKKIAKGDIDAEAAVIILNDYLGSTQHEI